METFITNGRFFAGGQVSEILAPETVGATDADTAIGVNLSFGFTGAVTLQSATDISGSWSDVASYTVGGHYVANRSAETFYRLLVTSAGMTGEANYDLFVKGITALSRYQSDNLTRAVSQALNTPAGISQAGGATHIVTRVLAAAANPVKTGVMASPITIVKGTDNTASTLTGSSVGFNSVTGAASATIQTTDPRLTAIRGTWKINGSSGWIGDGVTRGTGVRSGSNGQGFAFCMSGTAFDVSLLGGTNSGNDSKMNVRVTHLTTGVRELINATDFLVSSTAAAYYLVSGLAAGPKIIECYFGRRVSVRGFNVAPTDTIWKVPVRSNLNAAALGDSYIDGPTTDTLCGGYVWHLGEALGIENIRPLGISQSGWVAAPSGSSWLYRIQNGDLDVSRIGNLDLLFIYGSINDNAQTDAEVQSAMISGLTLIKQKQPRAVVVHAGPQFTSLGQTAQSRYDAMKTAFETVYPVGSRGVWIDNSPSGAPWMTGLGDTGATTGSGNNDLYLDTDKTHWNAAGHKFGGNRFGAAVIEAARGMMY